MNDTMHEPSIARASMLFAGPCSCGPAIHINLLDALGHIFATAVIRPDECDELIKQIRASKKAVLKCKR